MESKEYDTGMLTFEDRYPYPPYKHTDTALEDELAWAQTVESTTCADLPTCGLGIDGKQHGILCPLFDWQDDYSNSSEQNYGY